MKKGIWAGDAPIGVDVLEGKSYYWCSCGKSAKQPFCDGSHEGSEFLPLKVKVDTEQDVFFCGCKKSKKGAMCDGSHKEL